MEGRANNHGFPKINQVQQITDRHKNGEAE